MAEDETYPDDELAGDDVPVAGPLPDDDDRDHAPDEPVVEDPAELERDRQRLLAVEAELDQRWPETRIAPSLDRIATLLNLLGEPHKSYPVVQVAGTNGKGSTVRMIDTLLSAMGLRVGRYTSPHLQIVTERIALDGEPIRPGRYVDVYQDLAPFVAMVDRAAGESGQRMTKFEVLTGMAYAAFADAPVDVAVVEAGMGGSWDATSVADAQIAAIAPISLDHTDYLGEDLRSIAAEKAGIIKPGSIAVIGEQHPEAMRVLLERAVEVDATVARSGQEFGVLKREIAVGGQMLTLQGLGGVYDEIMLPLHGEHQAKNAALALATVEAFLGAGKDRSLEVDTVREAFAAVQLPARLERARSAPTVLLDAAHNPAGAAAVAEALDGEFAFRRLALVVSIMRDKDARGILDALEPVVHDVVVTRNSSPRAMPVGQLGKLAREIFGEDRVVAEPDFPTAFETAVSLVEEGATVEQELSGGGVLITGSVVTAGDARTLLGLEPA